MLNGKHWTKYSTLEYLRPRIRFLRIFSTSNSCWWAIKVGKGSNIGWFVNCFGRDTCFCHRDTWNTWCIFICDGSFNLYDTSPTGFNLIKVSMNLGLKNGVHIENKFVVDSQTLSPTWKTNSSQLALAYYFCQFWAIKNFSFVWFSPWWICSTNSLPAATLVENYSPFKNFIKLDGIMGWTPYMR